METEDLKVSYIPITECTTDKYIFNSLAELFLPKILFYTGMNNSRAETPLYLKIILDTLQ